MSLRSAELFLKKFKEDDDFRHSIENASNDDERRKIKKDHGFDFTKEEISALLRQEPAELSSSDLESIAGGTGGGVPGVSGGSAAAAVV